MNRFFYLFLILFDSRDQIKNFVDFPFFLLKNSVSSYKSKVYAFSIFPIKFNILAFRKILHIFQLVGKNLMSFDKNKLFLGISNFVIFLRLTKKIYLKIYRSLFMKLFVLRSFLWDEGRFLNLLANLSLYQTLHR